MRGGSEVDDLHSVRLTIWVEKHDVLGLQVGVNQAQLLQFKERGENLLSYWPDVLEGQRLELVLFEEVVQILLQHLEYEAGVVLVCEALVGSDKIVFVRIFLAKFLELKQKSGNCWLGVELSLTRLKLSLHFQVQNFPK